MRVGAATLSHAGSIEVSSAHVFAGTFAPTIGLAGWWVEALTLEPTILAADAYEPGISCASFRCNGILLERALGDIMVRRSERAERGGAKDVPPRQF